MNRSQPRARIKVRAEDPQLRSRIVERLEGLGDISIDENGTDPAEAAVEISVGSALTPREAEVLRLLSEGLANKEIAARLSFSTHTAKFHVESILRKLGAANRAEAVMEGIRQGLLGL
jgi:DNA-binding NarL/FixJ family response regulator